MARVGRQARIYETALEAAIAALADHGIRVQRPSGGAHFVHKRGTSGSGNPTAGADYRERLDIMRVYVAHVKDRRQMQVDIGHELIHKWAIDGSGSPPDRFRRNLEKLQQTVEKDLPHWSSRWEDVFHNPREGVDSRANLVQAAEILIAGTDLVHLWREKQDEMEEIDLKVQELGNRMTEVGEDTPRGQELKDRMFEWVERGDEIKERYGRREDKIIEAHRSEFQQLLGPILSRFDRVDSGLGRLNSTLGEAWAWFWTFYRWDELGLQQGGEGVDIDFDARARVEAYLNHHVLSNDTYAEAADAIEDYFGTLYDVYERQRGRHGRQEAVRRAMRWAKQAFHEERRRVQGDEGSGKYY